jgi:hypothetical protein
MASVRVELKEEQFLVFSGNGIFVTRFSQIEPAMDWVVECLQDEESGAGPELGPGVPADALQAARLRAAKAAPES